MRLVLCDDQLLLVEAMATALQAKGHEVVAIATSAPAGVAAVLRHRPDVCLLDLRFPGDVDGLTAARAICDRRPGTCVLVLSGVSDPRVLGEVIGTGVAGIIRKDQSIDRINAAIERVAAGEAVYDSALVRDVLQKYVNPIRNEPQPYLAPREREVLDRVADGQSTEHMAQSMGIATSTVRTYVQNVMTKLGVHSRVQVAALAAAHRRVAATPSTGVANGFERMSGLGPVKRWPSQGR